MQRPAQPDPQPVWVDGDRHLADLCTRWRGRAALALDTEFMRSRTFYPLPALVQISDGKHCYLIDILALENLQPLRELMADTRLVKVVHACGEDLETLDRLLGVIPEPVFDTQIAAAFAGLGVGVGYGNLVKQLLQIALPKGETRSDWLQRPLTEAQKKYAALDVAWLFPVYQLLFDRLQQAGRLQWLQEDCATLVASARNPEAAELYYRGVKGAPRLNPRQLAVLRDICAWREGEARRRNMPRNHLLKERVCLALAEKMPKYLAALAQPGLEGKTLRQYGDTLLQLITAATARSDLPESLPQPLDRQRIAKLKLLREKIGELANSQQLPAEILVRKKELEALLRAPRPCLQGRMLGWRRTVVGQPLLDYIAKLDGDHGHTL